MAFGYLAPKMGNLYKVTSNNADLGNGAEGDIRSPSFFCSFYGPEQMTPRVRINPAMETRIYP
jgi:hypothetical protein